MNWEGFEPDSYYQEQEQKHFSELKVWLIAAGIIAVLVIVWRLIK